MATRGRVTRGHVCVTCVCHVCVHPQVHREHRSTRLLGDVCIHMFPSVQGLRGISKEITNGILRNVAFDFS